MNPFAILGLCAVAGLARGGGDPLEVRMKPSAQVRGLEIRVGDLCEFVANDRETLELAKVTFGRSPGQGHARVIGRTELLQALAAAGHDLARIKIEGARETTVQAVVVDVPAGELVDAATTALHALLAVEGGDVEFDAPRNVTRVQAPPGRIGQEIVARVRGGRTAPTSAVVDVEIRVDGELCKRVPVTFPLRRYQSVLKTVGPVRAGTLLGPQNLEIAREPVAQGTNLLLTDFAQIEGMVAARDLQANRRLMLADTAPPDVVQKGEMVTVVIDRGRVKATARAIANHGAPIGGRLTLTNPDSKKQLVGVVTAPGLVVLQG